MKDRKGSDFSVLILTLNEELHLSRLLGSIQGLYAPVYILDSGSTDKTREIAIAYGAEFEYHKFENHPNQWRFALEHFKIDTPWIVALDADQYVSPELFQQLLKFRDSHIDKHVSGIYFNRKNYFKGHWIRHGGYFPKYMLKMFRTSKGNSSLAEKLDHRFFVDGDTIIWKNGYLIEENLKENSIGFWIDKHNKYSSVVAHDEYERTFNKDMLKTRHNSIKQGPDRKVLRQKELWRRMPLLVRPFLYFIFRYFIQLGFLDGREGLIFHGLHAFWFRFVVDVKIMELKNNASKSNNKILS